MGEYRIDLQALTKDIRNRAKLEFILNMQPDPENRKLLSTVMDVFLKHGLELEEAMFIMLELGSVLKEWGNENEKR